MSPENNVTSYGAVRKELVDVCANLNCQKRVIAVTASGNHLRDIVRGWLSWDTPCGGGLNDRIFQMQKLGPPPDPPKRGVHPAGEYTACVHSMVFIIGEFTGTINVQVGVTGVRYKNVTRLTEGRTKPIQLY
jgi:hypothetical protein